jgi:hypothetical protein
MRAAGQTLRITPRGNQALGRILAMMTAPEHGAIDLARNDTGSTW